MAEPDPRRPEESEREGVPPRGPARPLLAIASLVPLAASAVLLVAVPPPAPVAAPPGDAQSAPGAVSLWCAGPLEVPEEAIAGGGDADLAATPPAAEVSASTVALEPESSLLYGTVAGAETLQEEDGSIRAPRITTELPGGEVLGDQTSAQDLGVGTQQVRGIPGAPVVVAGTSQEGRPVADAVQYTWTPTGDYRSLSVSRCSEPTTEASFLGMSTTPGDSSVLVLRNPTERAATASVQVRTSEGPAAMEGRSQIVVPPGEQEQLLLESVAGGEEVLGVQASVLGAPLAMHVQTTRREGLTPGGAELLQPLAAASADLVIPGVEVTDAPPTLVLASPGGAPATADVEVLGPDGPLALPGLTGIELASGAVSAVPLDGLAAGAYAVRVTADAPVLGVVRTTAPGADLPGDTVGAPVDLTVVEAVPAISAAAVTALPAEGIAGALHLSAVDDTQVTVIPIATDGSAGAPLEVAVPADAAAEVPALRLLIDGASPAGLAVVPDVPGVVHASWMQRQDDGAGSSTLLSSLPVRTPPSGGRSVAVQLTDPV